MRGAVRTQSHEQLAGCGPAVTGERYRRQGKQAPGEETAYVDKKGASRSFAIDGSSAVAGKVGRLKRVMELTGLARSSVYDRMNPRSPHYDPTFPRSFKFGAADAGAAGWDEEQVRAGLLGRPRLVAREHCHVFSANGIALACAPLALVGRFASMRADCLFHLLSILTMFTF